MFGVVNLIFRALVKFVYRFHQDVEIPSQPVYPVTISFVAGPDGEEIEFFQERCCF